MAKKILILGAFDRFNYGDLIFAIIIENLFNLYKKDFDIEYYGLIKSDLSKYGGKKTNSIKELFRSKKNRKINALIIAGGEILDSRWLDIYINLGSVRKKYLLLGLNKIIGRRKIEKIISKLIGSDSKLPWVVTPNDFNIPLRVIYNAVGGSNLQSLPDYLKEELKNKLNEASYISIRDEKTKKNIEYLNLKESNIELAPDSAVLLSDFYPIEKLRTVVNLETLKITANFPNGYICFQSNYLLSKDKEKTIAKELEKLNKKFGYGIVLLPIGRATGHEDQTALLNIKKLLRDTPSILPNENTIYDIMYLIANSKMFAGTSLHGSITALSYCVPHVGLTNKVSKLENFLNTWDLEEQKKCIAYEDIVDHASYLINIPHEKLAKRRDELISLSYRNFEKILSVIET